MARDEGRHSGAGRSARSRSPYPGGVLMPVYIQEEKLPKDLRDLIAKPNYQYAPETEVNKDNQDISKGAAKHDAGKVRMDLVPMEFVYGTAAALTYGAEKYEAWNWSKGLRKGRVMAALLRHAYAWLARQDLDPETNLPHTWHMAACLAMLIGCEARGTAIEDRQDAQQAIDYVEKHFSQM